MELVFATNNPHKLQEIRSILSQHFELKGLKDICCNEELPETQPTIEGNASQKAFYVHKNYGVDCFADDTGLEIEALGGNPGVMSARYAGEQCSFEDNMNKVLNEMQSIENRKACFRTIISLIIDGKEHQFEGRVDGIILKEKRGEEGFGYDPIFAPVISPSNGEMFKDHMELSFAEMPLEEKNRISHRGRAVRKLNEFLTANFQSLPQQKR
ncbi:MAG: non-canonical purine NTP pyrophosphatase, RdgB/HAM1 family [Flavobacteriales bacterium]|nr:MAG: non-canonical purine NTP pyrophosphatase, RdgB/HAM1 family [Flavobacteriales bacterium]